MGIANAAPDSRTPRRFIAVSTATAATPARASWPFSSGIAVAAYCAAELIDTATVST